MQTTASSAYKIERYPGIPPFSMAQKEVFFGRKADVERLYNLEKSDC